MNKGELISQLQDFLFWDVDKAQVDANQHSGFIVQRVLEYGQWNDWLLIRNYYGLAKIVELCKQMRSLDPVCLSYICAISHTKQEDYRCYTMRQLMPTLWNS